MGLLYGGSIQLEAHHRPAIVPPQTAATALRAALARMVHSLGRFVETNPVDVDKLCVGRSVAIDPESGCGVEAGYLVAYKISVQCTV